MAWPGPSGAVGWAVGADLPVKVFHVTDRPRGDLPADVTYDGKFRVDFAGSVMLLRPRPIDAAD